MKKITLLTILILCLNPSFGQYQEKLITLEDVYRFYRFFPVSVENHRSLNSGKEYTLLSKGQKIEKYSYQDGSYLETILDLEKQSGLPFTSFSAYEFSPDENKILLTTERENIYRRSYLAAFYIYDRASGEMQPLSNHGKQQLPTFSPDGSKIAFVRENNLFIKDLLSEKEIQVTYDGKRNEIINGAPDWVYEEEFGFSKGFAWSPDGYKIAYYRFDEKRVREFNMTLYNGLYPEWYRFKYPKAGEENSKVTIHCFDLKKDTITELDTGPETDQYIPRIKWTADPEVLSVIRLNRLQNFVEILHSEVKTGNSTVVYEEREEKYISEVSDDMVTYLKNGEECIIRSEKDGWSHLYLYNFINGDIKPITSGEFDVSKIHGVDEDGSILYYSSHERGPLYLDTWKIRLDGKKKKLLTKNRGWNETEFSKGFRFFINTYSDANTPPFISLCDNHGNMIRILEDNTALVERMREYNFTPVEFFSFTTQDGLELPGYMIKPPDFNVEKKYPVLFYVYGGPESQSVKDQFSAYRGAWFQMLAQQGFIIACVDNRGTNGRGEAFRKATYMQLGKYETTDQIEAAYFLSSLEYVDKARIGIFGWSYGGFMSLNCLFKGSDIFSLAVAVAPVTNWRYYDTIYTERFMRTPQENQEGYDQNSPIFFADQMKGKLLLIHGMADDNVHLQNSTELVKALVEADKAFDSEFYPDKNHGICGGNTTMHLYGKLTHFILENL